MSEHWNRVAELPDPTSEVCDVDIDSCLGAILPHIDHSEGATVLDLGCGYGRLSIEVARRHRCLVIGLDSSPEMVKRANLSVKPTDDILFLCGDGTEMPVLSLNSAFSIAMFQHVDDETMRGYIHQVAARLKPYGRFRFQYVEGADEQVAPLSFTRTQTTVAGWCDEAGLETMITTDLLHEGWTWITAEKR